MKALFSLLLALYASPGLAAPLRVLAVGDLHGDLAQTRATLRLAKVIDADDHWVGGQTVLVQTGDITDRGPDSKELITLFRQLEREAPITGGVVHVLLGNHEVMNLMGDLRYVHPDDYVHFGGQAARAKAFGPDGEVGNWLVNKPIAVIVEGTLFVHGGLSESWASKSVAELNQEARAAFSGGDRSILGQGGPLWYRDYVQLPESTVCPSLKQALIKQGVKRMVVGHTVRRDGHIQSRCGGQLQVIDIGISRAYSGAVGAWEWSKDDARALYPSGITDLPDPR